MQRHRVSMISNFFAEPMGQPDGVGLIRRWSILNRFLFANGRMIEADVFLEVWQPSEIANGIP
jgi:hypothetical protein